MNTEKIISVSLDVMSALFCVLFLTFSLLAVNHYHFDTNIMNEYKVNWNKGPIIDIIKSNSSTCPEGYEFFITNTFPSIHEGCDCSHSDDKSYNGNIYQGKCDQYHVASGCRMVFPSDKILLSKWRGNTLCVMRMNRNFWQLLVTSNDKSCPNGLKQCGIFDSFHNILCILPDETCPINGLTILPKGITPPFEGYKTISLDDDIIMYFTHENYKEPVIVEIEARETLECAHPFEAEFGMSTYPLNSKRGPSECKTKIKGELYDWRFTQLDSENRLEFYNENEINKVIGRIPNYPPSKQSKVYLYMINYFGWNKSCYNNHNFNQLNLVTPQEKVDKYFSKSYSLAVVSVIHFIFILLTIMLYKLLIEKYSIKESQIILIDVLHLVLLFVILILSIVIINGTNTILSPYNEFVDNKCGDEFTNATFTHAIKDIGKVNGYLIPMTILSSIEIAYMVFYYIWYYYIRQNN